jgi:hypothetical protein
MAKKKSAKKGILKMIAGKKATTKKPAKKTAKKSAVAMKRSGKKAPAMKRATAKKVAPKKKKVALQKKGSLKKKAPATITGRIGDMLGAAGEGIASVARTVLPTAPRSESAAPTAVGTVDRATSEGASATTNTP